MGRIDLSKYSVRTDLMIENIDENKYGDNIDIKNINDDIKVTTVRVDDDLSDVLKKKNGLYITIEFLDVTNHDDREIVKNIFEDEFSFLLDELKISRDMSCLVVGLGNRNSTADSLGPRVIDKIMVTRHLFLLDSVSDGVRNVSAISPGVMATTGIETYDTIISIINKVSPDFLIVIDSLASLSISRINRTIQITDTGIHPGSGVGNNRKEISFDTIGIPVIAIGVPTVVESSIIVSDTIDYLFKHISYIKNNYNLNKLVIKHNKNYLSRDISELSCEEKRDISGMLGELSVLDKYNLISEVLDNLDYNLIVTPKEIDFLVDYLSRILSSGLNRVLNDGIIND